MCRIILDAAHRKKSNVSKSLYKAVEKMTSPMVLNTMKKKRLIGEEVLPFYL